MSRAIVAIVGRPNVGKSTLFNRILGVREAIVHDLPGVTRDRKYAEAEWAGYRFTVVDTGGFVPDSDDVFQKAIREQAEIAIEEADVVVFVVDAADGIVPLDRQLAEILRKTNKPVHLVVNKIDSARRELLVHEFHGLGVGEPHSISALGGRQIGDFLDVVCKSFKASLKDDEEETRIRLAVIGKPNVGKSSLVNALLGVNRSVVSDIPGTTRDSIDSVFKYYGDEVVLVDTAGLRKKNRVKESLEFFSALRTLRSIDHSDVAVILFDAERGVDKQDLHIVETALEYRRPSLIAVNKWDVVEKDTNTARDYERVIRDKLGMYDYLPIVFISALTKQRVTKIIEVAKDIHAENHRRIGTSRLNEILLPIIQNNPPVSSSPKEIKIKYITQPKSGPPVFSFFCNEPKLVQESYRRFLMNKIREHFGFQGVPITIAFRQK